MDHWKMCGNDKSASYLGWARKPLSGKGQGRAAKEDQS